MVTAPENTAYEYDKLFLMLHEGILKVPDFQRSFVWSLEQTAKLVDSLIKGFPVGVFILWKTKEELKTIRNIGNAVLPDRKPGEPVYYVLDGQQRITSLYAIRRGVIAKDEEEEEINFEKIFIDLQCAAEEQSGDIVTLEPPTHKRYISVHRLLNQEFLTDLLQEGFDKDEVRKIELFKNRLTGRAFPIIVLDDYPIDIATEVFTRINTGGTELSLYEIMVAKTYDLGKGFDLAKEYKKLVDSGGKTKDLSNVEYENISRDTLLQCVSAIATGKVKRRDILNLSKPDFISNWEITVDGLFGAIDYLRIVLGAKTARLLPYGPLLIPFAYFFVKNKNKNPTGLQDKLLAQYFWWVGVTERFTAGFENKVEYDLSNRINKILKEERPDYKGDEPRLKEDDLIYRQFSPSSAFCRTILCLLASLNPKSFRNNAAIKIENDWLKTRNSKNYHHFFPRAYLEKVAFDPPYLANSLVNITFVDDYLNKRQIRDKSPNLYISEFAKLNKDISGSLNSHLIGNVVTFGISDDNYKKFLKKRAGKILTEINKRLAPSF